MQVPNRRVHKMIEELDEIVDRIWAVDKDAAEKLEGMSTYFKGNFKSRPVQKVK